MSPTSTAQMVAGGTSATAVSQETPGESTDIFLTFNNLRPALRDLLLAELGEEFRKQLGSHIDPQPFVDYVKLLLEAGKKTAEIETDMETLLQRQSRPVLSWIRGKLETLSALQV